MSAYSHGTFVPGSAKASFVLGVRASGPADSAVSMRSWDSYFLFFGFWDPVILYYHQAYQVYISQELVTQQPWQAVSKPGSLGVAGALSCGTGMAAQQLLDRSRNQLLISVGSMYRG